MKKQKEELKNLRKLNLKELISLVSQKRTELARLKRELKFGKLKNCKKVQDTQKALARILTIISEKAEEKATEKVLNKQ